MSMDDLYSHVWSEFDSAGIESVRFLGCQAVVYSSPCPTRDRSENEDSACLIEVASDRGLIAVADGVGGGARGNEASRCAVQSLMDQCLGLELEDEHLSRGLRTEILDGIENANQTIVGWRIGACTTLTAVELAGQQLRYFHVGDSGALVISNRGKIKFATVGHAPVAQAVEIGMLDAQEALVHEDRNLITNCLGSTELKIEVGTFRKLAPRDTLLLASDGLFDNMTVDEIAELIRKGNLQEQVGKLVALAKARMADTQNQIGKPDDITVIGWRPQKVDC